MKALIAFAPTLAQQVGGGISTFGVGQWVILIIVVIAVLAILWAFVQYSGVQIPPLLVKVFWIVVAAVICCVGVKIVMSLL